MDLTPVERRVWEGFASGAQVVTEAGEPVRASVIAGLMPGAQSVPPGFRKRVWLSGAAITGPLDLSATVLDCEFIATGCAFDGPVGFGGVHARTIDLSASRFTTLRLADATIEGRLDLTEVVCELVSLRGGGSPATSVSTAPRSPASIWSWHRSEATFAPRGCARAPASSCPAAAPAAPFHFRKQMSG